MTKIELLAPAGDLERLKITLLYGADAVYLGGSKLGLRANAINFSMEQLKEGCEFAHSLGKKVYLTVNIVFHEEDRLGLVEYLEEVVACGIDAVIVSDPYLVSFMHEHYPTIDIHLSTQASTTNIKAASFYQDLGVKRIVLAREVGKKEMQEIITETGLEIEVFIHGAMCTCISGRCALSNYATNRDANRGGCAQVCRFVFSTEEEDFMMASKDLSMAPYIKDLIEIGVTSLKVEGRMRSLYYLATVISSYRALIDAYYDGTMRSDFIKKHETILARVANREVSSHYFEEEVTEEDQYFSGRNELSNQDYLGIVTGYDQKKQHLIIEERNFFVPGDKVEIFTPAGDIYPYQIDKIYDEFGALLLKACHPRQILFLPFPIEVPKNAMIRLIERKEQSHGSPKKSTI